MHRRGGSSARRPPPAAELVRIHVSRAGVSCGTEVFGQDEILVGRAPGCDVVLWGPEVSRQHAKIRRVGDGWGIEDLASRHGLTLNGQRVQRALLRAGDQLTLGTFVLRLELPATDEAACLDEDDIVTEVNSGLRTPVAFAFR
jgi:pSer/pThr/pTyr-binding forkhead associated (FHA) protein